MVSSWAFNVVNPQRHRMRLAHHFSREARKIFGDNRWKGVYVIGSTAHGKASFLSDLDIFPLMLDPSWNSRKGPEWEAQKRLLTLREELALENGVAIDIWINRSYQIGSFSEPYSLGCIISLGAEHAIKGPAILVDSESYLKLQECVGEPEANRYAIKKDAKLRGNDLEAEKTRIAYEREQCEFRCRLVAAIQEILPKYSLGEWERLISLLILSKNLYAKTLHDGLSYEQVRAIFLSDSVVNLFLREHPPADKSQTQYGILQKICRADSPNGLAWRQKLQRLNAELQERKFSGIPKILFDQTEAATRAVERMTVVDW